MKLLLDTHVWIWRLLEPERLSAAAGEVLADPGNELHLSPISVWETLVLARKGKLELDGDPRDWVRQALRLSSPTMAPLTHEVALASEGLDDFPTGDPVDRFLAATAQVGSLALVTADRSLLNYPPLETVW